MSTNIKGAGKLYSNVQEYFLKLRLSCGIAKILCPIDVKSIMFFYLYLKFPECEEFYKLENQEKLKGFTSRFLY